MINEVFAEHAWLWPVLWQSTAALALGLLGSFALRERAARAHQLLLLALLASVAVPVLSQLVKQHEWGLLRSRPATVEVHPPAFVALDAPTPGQSTPGARISQASTPETTRAAQAATSTPRPVEWTKFVLPAWVLLSTALLIRLIVRFILGFRLARRSEPCEANEIACAIAKAKARIGIRTDVLLHQSPETRSPVIWCWGVRPTLLVPQGAHDDDSIDWASIVCHELAHWKRRDHLSGLWTELALCVLPFNPLVWLAQRQLKRLSEQACDDWVIAAGQTGTRYARTLLGLTPQGRAALIPAVVSSKKGLAARVRRILANQCASPHLGRRWSVVTATLITGLAVTIAFAQAKPAEPTGMTKTTLAHGAVIEQPASTGTIKGVVLDPNGQPTPDRTTGVTVLPLTCHSTRADEEGQFEIQWSPSWIDPGQPAYIVARNGDHHLAAIATTTDPTAAVAITLAPALTIRGQVGTLDGQSITQGAAALSLPIQFNCRAPIAAAEIDPNGTFAIQTVPGDQTYTLEIYAKGYHSKRITVATKNRNTNAVDLGSITLLPKAPGQADVIAKGPNPNWREDFDRIYRLNEEQTLRLVKAPFPLARQDRLINMTRNEGASDNMLDYPHIYTQYRWEGHLEEGCWYGNSSGPVRIQTVMLIFLDIPSYEFELPEELANTHLARGDWIARKDATTEEKILALQEIIHEELRQPIRFEKRQVERDAIVVTGRYAFAPLPEGDPNRLCVTVDEMQDLENDEAESLPQLFAWLANGINTTIDDRTEPTENRKILYSYDWNLLSPPLHVDRIDKKKLPLLLDNLAKQTGLTFTLKKRPVDVWFISEDTREGKG